VIASVNVPALVELQDTVAVPEPVTVPGIIAPQASPVGTVSVRVTTPEKPLTAVIVIVEVAEAPALTAAGEDALIVKSTTWNMMDPVEWLSVPDTPVTVAV
jgi:hypothetical protein